ncbi:LuxR C-terminal-related transcriptional regulator [Microbacterium sp. JZ31]|uniref:LuxR C-terminal-related transcriptional regulator n=1 Tax=Microbacterium sp. JZ31 TaxID=1906274 RepID=UPI001933E7EB|nr:LuxR C-terminal-related transcriptional regulator [Microbacterium sp. JZ31]
MGRQLLGGAGASDNTVAEQAIDVLRDALDSGRVDLANAQVISSWAGLLDAHAAEVRTLLTPVPSDHLVRYSLLGLLLGFASFMDPATRPRASRYFEIAVLATRARHPRAAVPERIALHCAESAALRQLGQMRGATSAARAAVRLLNVAADEHLAQIGQLPRVYADLGWTFFESGRSEEALVAFLRGLSASKSPADSSGNRAAICAMQALEGDILSSRENIARARVEVRREDGDIGPRGRVHVELASALLELEDFETDAAARHLAEIGPVSAVTEGWIERARLEAAIALVAGRPGEGLAELDRVLRMRAGDGRSRYAQCRLAPVRALLQLALGNVEAAGVLLRETGGTTPQIRVGLARVELVRGRLHAALNAIAALPVEGLSPRTVAEATAIEAAVLLRLPSTFRALGAIDRLGALARSTGLRLPLAFLPRSDFERVRDALTLRGYGDLFVRVHAVLPESSVLTLTTREVALLRALAEPDASRAGIAEQLHVSVNTVKTQLRLLYRKLGVSDRQTALAVAFERRLLDESDEAPLR